jgi:hypothetical protein
MEGATWIHTELRDCGAARAALETQQLTPDGCGLELKHDKAGVSLVAPRDPGIPPHSLPATLRMTGLSPILSCSQHVGNHHMIYRALTFCGAVFQQT